MAHSLQLFEQKKSSKNHSMSARFRFVVMVFVASVLLLLTLTYLGMSLMSTARAYAVAEKLWSQGQRSAVVHLMRYAESGDALQFAAYEKSISIPMGDLSAREAMDSPERNYSTMYEGLLAGGSHANDISGMIRLDYWGGNAPFLADIFQIWRDANVALLALNVQASRLKQLTEHDQKTTPAWQSTLLEIEQLDKYLNSLADDFGVKISRVGRLTAEISIIVVVGGGFILLIMASFLSIRLVRRVEDADRDLRYSEEKYRALAQHSSVGMWQLNDYGRVVYLNPAMEALLGTKVTQEMMKQPYNAFFTPESYARLRASLFNSDGFSMEVQLRQLSGQIRDVLISGAPVCDADNVIQNVIGTCIDITDATKAKRILQHRAWHDSLTDIPNRDYFMLRLNEALAHAKRNKATLAVFFLDLDDFKLVNDQYGHLAGDQLLVEATRRITECLRKGDVLARVGGDEFSILLQDSENTEALFNLAKRIIDSTRQSLVIEKIEMNVQVSIGIALTEGSEMSSRELLRRADVAMYAAKRKGPGQYQLYTDKLDEEYDQGS